MKITKEQTALIIMVVGSVISLIAVATFIRTHPIYALVIIASLISIGIGYYMYYRNKNK